jgi:hypothetical protein
MLLRKNKHYRGFYKDFNRGVVSTFITFTKHRVTKPASPAFRSEIRALEFLMLKHLKNLSGKSPLITDKFEPTERFQKYLVENYQVNISFHLKKIEFFNLSSIFKLGNKFIDGSKFLKDHCLPCKRFFNENDYCSIYSNRLGESSFKIKLANPTNLFYFDSSLFKRKISYKRFFHFKFIVDENKKT